MNTRSSLARIFYRPSEVLALNWEKHRWAYIFLLLFALSYADTIIGFRTTASSNVAVNVIPAVLFFVIVLVTLALLILIDALYLRVVSAILGLDLKLDHWLGFVTWSGVPGAVFVLMMTTVLSLTLIFSSDVQGREANVLMDIISGSRFSNPSVSSLFQYRYIADLWVVGLQTIGLREWSGKPPFVCFSIAIVPIILAHIVIRWCFF